MARPAHDHDRKRSEIVELSRDLIGERGVEAFNLGDVAESAGVTAPALYHYFSDRKALLVEVLRLEVQDVVAATMAGDDGTAAPLTRLRHFLERQCEFLTVTRPGATAFLLSSLLAGRDDPDTWPVVSQTFGAAELFFRRTVSEAHERGELARGVDVEGGVAVLRAGLAGVFLIRALDVGFDPRIAAAEMLRGIAATPGSTGAHPEPGGTAGVS